MQTKTDYIEGTRLQLDLWGEQLASLEERAARSPRKKRIDLERSLAALQRRKRRLKRRLREAAGGTKSNWADVRPNLEQAAREFRMLAIEVYDSARGVV